MCGKAAETVWLGLGSNEGDRMAAIDAALERIGALPGTRLEDVSRPYTTQPQGRWSSSDPGFFINRCCRISTTLEPLQLLKAVKGIEAELGRNVDDVRFDENGGRIYSDRPIDIDILLFGDRKVDLPQLKIPHQRMLERDFVMIPLKEIMDKENK